MTSTYSSHPFISHDGPDKDKVRAEVRVVTGLGHVKEIKESENGKGKAVNVLFSVENNQYYPSGWVPKTDPVMEVVEKAQVNNEPIYFRIETQRKRGVDRSIPMEELTPKGDMTAAKNNTNKALAAAKFEDATEWVISPYAHTNMAEDPAAESNSANNYTLEELQELSGKAHEASKPKESFSGSEPPPYVTMRNNKVLPGSTAVSVPLTIHSFVNEYARDNGLEVDEKDKLTTAKAVLHACNRAQMEITKTEKPDLGAPSHTRARALVFEMIKSYYPLTTEIMSSRDELIAWVDQAVDKSVKMWRWSIKEVTDLMK